ncbi:uncharacterized protein LOC130675126 [Microplitis mediator]|uniref:uncharacterized protein LOC130675126 n=1 Tax=Microplitis mediator TaxID=375433 RepID=UPI002554B045|nr:uncharacterized protein LOC130675126 [Microplitis mediator]
MVTVMELSPYLSGIQKLQGSTPGEKYLNIHKIAQKILPSKNIKKALESAVNSSELPEALKLFVQLEIARSLRQPEVIIEALKSGNDEIFNRALKTRWFFNGGNENITTVHFYQTQILPFLSVYNRKKIIKVLAKNLADEPELADEFYELVTLMYGEKQAKSLLKACSESFIWSRIKNNNIELNGNMIHFLFNKYPELVIKYFKLTKWYGKCDFSLYSKFLPHMLRKYPEVYGEVLQTFNEDSSPLSMRQTRFFLDNFFDAFMINPSKFLSRVHMKVMKSQLTEEQRQEIFRKLVLADDVSFSNAFTGKFGFLSDDKKLTILMSHYQEVHGVNFLDCHDKITPKILRILPRDERIRQARKKLETESYPADKLDISFKKSWVCYLPCSESVKFYKELIEKSEKSERFEGVKRLIYTCAVNCDSDALLDVLEYIKAEFINEYCEFITNTLRVLWYNCKSMKLTIEHWEVINSLLVKITGNDENFYDFSIADWMKDKIIFDIENNKPIDISKNSLFLKYMRCHYNDDDLLELKPAYAKKCLEEFINGIPSTYDDVNDIDIDQIIDILQSIADFNGHKSRSRERVAAISIRNHPWLAATVKKFLNDKYEDGKEVKRLRSTLKSVGRDVFEAYVAEVDKDVDFKTPEAQKSLEKNPELIIQHWEHYLDKCIGNINRRCARKFVRTLCWYQDLPIKFADKCLRHMKKHNSGRELIVLGLMLEGPAFERVAAPFISKIDAEHDHKIMASIPRAIRVVNPPVSLEFVLKFCEGNNIHVMGNCLLDVSRKTSVAKVIPFAMALMKEKMPMKKYAIRLYCQAFAFDCTK